MDKFKVSTRLYILLAVATAAFTILLIIAESGMSHLGDLQDAGYRRSSESGEMQLSAKLGPVIYQVIADSIINHNLEESTHKWNDVKAKADRMLSRAQELADTPEEKDHATKASQAYQALVKIYESSVLPLLKSDAPLVEIRQFDDAIDAQAQAMDDHLTPLGNSLSAEAAEADKDFDSTRSQIISSSLITALAMLVVMVGMSLYISKSIIRQLGGEPAEARDIAQRIAAGNLSSRINVAPDQKESLMGSIDQMQTQLASLIQKIQESAIRVTTSADELAAASTQVSATSIQQSDDTASVAAAIEQLTSSIDVVANNAQEAEKIASESGKRSSEGAAQVKSATDEMSRIAETTNETSEQMRNLSEQSQQISSIANVIKEVADQTNLLALNAAIEAARAGEQGRGFAVVADEVRKLAERTTASAQEISTMVASIQEHTDKATMTMQLGNQRVSEGVALADRAGDSMRQISEGSREVVQAVSEISGSLREQRATSSDIAKRVEHIALITEENSTAVSSVATTATQLKQMAEDLRLAVSGFRV